MSPADAQPAPVGLPDAAVHRPPTSSPTGCQLQLALAFVLALTVGSLGLAPAAAQTPEDPLRVMVVGDSIASGRAGDVTARYRLERMLHARGLEDRVELVGRLTGTGAGGGPYRPAVEADERFSQRRHEAVEGQRAADVADPGCLLSSADGGCWIGEMVSSNEPDLVLIALGTNDLISAVDAEVVLGHIEQIVADARRAHAQRPDATAPLQLGVGQPLPFDCELRSAYYRDYGDACPRIAASYEAFNSGLVSAFADDGTVRIIDQRSGVDARDDLQDALHPAPSGEVLLAERWLEVILDVLGEEGVPSPAPVPPTADAGPDLEVEVGEDVVLEGGGSGSGAEPVFFDWRQRLVPEEAGDVERVQLSGEATQRLRFTAPATPQTLTLELQVSVFDAVARDTVTVRVVEPGTDPQPEPGTVDVAAPGDEGSVEVSIDTAAGRVDVRLDGVRSGGTLTATPADDVPGVRLVGPAVHLSASGVTHRAAQVCLPFEPSELAATIAHAQLLRRQHGDVDDLTTDRRDGDAICGFAGAGIPLGEAPATFAVGLLPLQRISGPDRVATAATLSSRTFSPDVGVAFIAAAGAYPDALAAGPLAGSADAPVLLVGDTLAQATVAELQRLGPERIAVVGGAAAVPDAVLTALAQHTDGPVERLEGRTRFETAAAAARASFATASTVYLASGQDFPDALAGGAAAAAAGAPLLLTGRDRLHPAAASALAALEAQRVVILGGTGAVGGAVADELEELVDAVERRSGRDRFATAAVVAIEELGDADVVYVATGEEFADALAGVPAAARVGAPVLLVGGEALPAPVAEALARLAPRRVVVLGGAAAVSEDVLRQLGSAGQG